MRDDIGDPGKIVARVRERLKSLSELKVPQQEGPTLVYRYGTPERRNGGDELRLKPALMQLAEVGWELFDRVFPGGEVERASLLSKLAGDAKVVQVAHTLLPKVIPWSAMYLRPYDAGQEEACYEGELHQVVHDACLAALPDENGNVPAAPCGQLENCVLHEARVKARLAAEGKVPVTTTVACPRAFLGFRHVVELPPQQVEPRQPDASSAPGAGKRSRSGNDSPTRQMSPLRTEIGVTSNARLALGINAKLRLWDMHEKELGKLCAGPPVRAVPLKAAYSRDAVLRTLQQRNLDLIYFFCHARGGPGSEVDPPVLEFQTTTGNPGTFQASNVDSVTWSHHPLVVVNACNTIGFSPTSLSPFIEKFVHDCEASGVIGTEIPVYEELSTEFAERFFRMFLGGENAGVSLLHARRALLAQLNPLGLAYTLYAAAELHIVPPT